MPAHTASVLVVGNGPSGLVAALILAQNGVSVRVVEKKTHHNVGQRGVGIQPRTLELHKFLGTYTDITSQGCPNALVSVHAPGGGTKPLKPPFQMIQEVEATKDIPFPNLWTLGQEEQETVLRSHLEKLGVKVELGVELLTISQSGSQVDVVLRHVSEENREEKVTYEYVIGADGAHSQVRKQLGLSFLGEERTENGFALGDAVMKNVGSLDHEYWNIWGDPTTKAFSLRAVHGSPMKYNFFIAGTAIDLDKMASSTLEELTAYAKEVTGIPELEFGELIWFGRWKPNIRMVDKFGEGRVFIAGDAAHCHSPTGAQGMNTSVQDASNIAWKIALVIKGHSPASILESYGAERLPVIATMLNKTTEILTKSYVQGGAANGGMTRPLSFRQLGVNYRGSPIISATEDQKEEGPINPYNSGEDGKVWPGDRAPEASVGLFNIFKLSHHTVLIFGDDKTFTAQAKASVAKWGAPTTTVAIIPKDTDSAGFEADHVLVDEDGSAFENYRIGGKQAIVVVRPDGVIGSKGEAVKSLDDYSKLVFNSA